jgi:hypothetical protein
LILPLKFTFLSVNNTLKLSLAQCNIYIFSVRESFVNLIILERWRVFIAFPIEKMD